MDSKLIILIWVSLIVIVLFLSYCPPPFNYFKARRLERKGNYKDACFWYAFEVLNGPNKRIVEMSRRKIKSLWEQYGPFDYTYIQDRDERGKIWVSGLKDAVNGVIHEIVNG